jgi:hypothetical protein
LQFEAFQHYVTATEDLKAWTWALKQWRPDSSIDKSLFTLIRDVDPTDTDARNFLVSLDVAGLRRLLQLPSDNEMIDAGVPKGTVTLLRSTGLAAKLEGLRNAAERRLRNRRAMIQAFNKAKHTMPVYAQREGGKLVLYFAIGNSADPLKTYRMEINPVQARWYASSAAVIQGVLHDTLATILVCRYGDEYEPPEWVRIVYELPDWEENGSS